jgi:AcrR family transcriptional regulator
MQQVVVGEGRRERKKRETRLALKAAALDLVSQRGYHNVTVEDIANAVDVSVRTFFNYFSSKEAAVVGEDPELLEDMRAQLLALPAEVPPLEAIRDVLMARADAISEDIDLSGEDHTIWLRRFSAVHGQPEVRVAYSKHMTEVEQAIADTLVQRLGGDERLRGYASLVTTCALSVMRVAGAMWAGQAGTCPLREVANAGLDLLARGFAIGPGPTLAEALPTSFTYVAGACPRAPSSQAGALSGAPGSLVEKKVHGA